MFIRMTQAYVWVLQIQKEMNILETAAAAAAPASPATTARTTATVSTASVVAAAE